MFACSAPVKDYDDQLYVNSANYKFIDELLDAQHEYKLDTEVPVWYSYPNQELFSPPYPAIILLHSSWGLSSQESYYTNIFKELGLAVYVIDSFTPRGVSRTSVDQSLVSSAAMIQDAYSLLNYLSNDSTINTEKIALMGFSKGGIAALYAAFNQVEQSVSNSQTSFAAHIAYYPWCGIRLYDMSTTGAPILIQGGDKDIITPVRKCEQMINEELDYQSIRTIQIQHHPNAKHAFDHPVLAKIPIAISLNAQVPALCDIRQNENGEFIEKYTDKKVTGVNVKAILQECSTFNGSAGSNSQATLDALDVTKKFIFKHVLN